MRHQYIKALEAVAARSKCVSRQVGALIVSPDDVIISAGWNGPLYPCSERYYHDDNLRTALGILNDRIDVSPLLKLCPRKALHFSSGEGLEYCPAIHAEVRAIANAALRGVSTRGATMLLTCGIPCKSCLMAIITAGIIELVVENFDFYDQLSCVILNQSPLIVTDYNGELYEKS